MHFTYVALPEVTWCVMYTELAETATVSYGTSHVSAASALFQWMFKKNVKRGIKS